MAGVLGVAGDRGSFVTGHSRNVAGSRFGFELQVKRTCVHMYVCMYVCMYVRAIKQNELQVQHLAISGVHIYYQELEIRVSLLIGHFVFPWLRPYLHSCILLSYQKEI